MAQEDVDTAEETTSIQDLTTPTYIIKAYDDRGSLVARDLLIEEESDLKRLKSLRVKSFVSTKAPITHKKLEDDEPEPELSNTEYDRNRRRYKKILNKMVNLFEEAREGEIGFQNLQDAVGDDIEFFIDQAKHSPESLSALSQLQSFHDETFEHSLNVCLLAILYGVYRNYKRDELKQLGFGALFHDIGKTAIPHEIIDKSEKLESEEWDLIKKHPRRGRDILAKIGADVHYQQIAYEHHSRPDGTGYPDGIEAHPHSRIVAVCDVYEALTASRVYKKSLSPLKAFVLTKEEFGDYTETNGIVSGLINALGIFPVGSFVELSNGELAIVKKIYPEDLCSPAVVVVTDKNEKVLDRPVVVSLHRLKSQKKAAHGEIYDDSTSINRILKLEEQPDLKREAATLIEREEPYPI